MDDRFYYMGRDVETLTKEELIEALKEEQQRRMSLMADAIATIQQMEDNHGRSPRRTRR